jgi:DNA-binding transcriptional MerR regulator
MKPKQQRLYTVTISENGVDNKYNYRGYTKRDVQTQAEKDLLRNEVILSIVPVKNSSKRIFLSRSEVADIYGVDPQTISNYVNKGVLKPCKCSKDRMMFDINMVESLRTSFEEIHDCEVNIHKFKEQIHAVQTELSFELQEAREAMGLNIHVNNDLGSDMLKSMVKVALGDGYNRMFNMLNDYLLGTEIKTIASCHGLTQERVLQIIRKAIETMATLRPYDEIMTENDTLRAENNALKRQVAALQAELQTCRSFDTKMTSGLTLEEYHLYELLKTRIEDLNISVRTLKPLICEDIKTLGDLLQYNKTDLLKLRNFGKKALTELDDLVEELNLSFGMKDEIQKLMKKYMMNNPEQ